MNALLRSHQELGEAVAILGEVLEGGFLVGGAVRDALLGFAMRPKDLDVICSLSDLARVRAKGIAGFHVGPNRHGNLRLTRGELTIDVFAPETFYGGFGTVEATLRHFDVNLNAVAWPLRGDRDVIDPLDARAGILNRSFRLIEERWSSTQDGEGRTVLLARLLKLWRRIPHFSCANCRSVQFDVELLFSRYPAVLEHHLGVAEPAAMAAELQGRLAGRRT